MPFREYERVWRTLRATWLELLAESNLLEAQPFLAMDGCPTGCGMATAQKLLIYAFVARTAVAGGQMRADYEAVVIGLLLTWTRLVTIEAVDTLLRVSGHLVFMYNRILQARMALGTFARGADKVGRRLGCLDAGALSIDKKSGQNKRKRNDNSQKHRTKRHAA